MIFASAGQAYVFLTTVAVGVLLAAGYEGVRLLRAGIRKKWWGILLDLLFAAPTVAIVGATLLFANEGEVRIYALLGFVMGALLYAGGIHPFVGWIAQLAKRVGQAFLKTRLAKRLMR